MNRFAIFFILAGWIAPCAAQEDIMDSYIREGFSNNLALKQKELNYHRSLQVLNQARALFFPEVGLSARFTMADGGRYIDFPAGDLLNPVYTTLNQLTHSHEFPQVDNQKVYFVRPTEQETRLSMVQPLIRPDIFFNYKIRKNLTDAAFIDINIYKRELVREIKTAYFNYLKTVKALELFDQTMKVVRENVRVNESLLANDKVTMDVVFRSRAEYSKVEQQVAAAQDMHERAKGYFNFLLNKSLKSDIRAFPGDSALLIMNPLPEDSAIRIALANREELTRLNKYKSASANTIKLYKFNTAPTLGLGIDYGVQGESYSFGKDSEFLFASLVLKWSIFRGFENRSKIREASVNRDILDEQYIETVNRIGLQVTDSWYGVNTALKTVAASQTQSESASKAFDLISKRYYQGQSSLLEFIDARTAMTGAELNLIIARYDYAISIAELERTMAIHPLD